jgi:2-oxoglutarate dehydrogenase E2 component (dihydrolipoamide succinyltransferase)
MATNVFVPRLGEGVDEVTIIKWLKQVGDSVNELEPLLEVNTDKVDTEIPAPASGVILRIEIQEGQPARVGELLAVIGADGEAVSKEQLSESSDQPAVTSEHSAVTSAPPAPQPSTVHSIPFGDRPPSTDLGFISPVVAKIAAEHGVNLNQITGTGLSGRITKNDVLTFIGNRTSGIVTPPAQPATLRQAQGSAFQPVNLPTQGDQLIKHTVIRKSIAEHMLMSKRTSPHVLTVMEADLSRISKHRAANKSAFERDGIKLTFTA